MKKAIKVLLGIIGALMLLLVAAMVIIPLVFNPNDYKKEIAAAVKEKTGRELLIPGEIKLSVFPWLGVETGEIQLNNAPGFGAEPFVKADHIAVKVRLWPLLSKTIEADTVTVTGLYLNLHRDASGRTNWDDLIAQPATPSPGPSPSETQTLSAVSATVGGLRLENATVIWVDDAKKTRYDISKLSLHTEAIRIGQPVELALGFNLKSKAPAVEGHIDLAAKLQFDLGTQKLALHDVKLSSQLRGAALPAPEMDISVTAQAALDLAAQHYQVNALQVNAALRGNELPGKRLEVRLAAKVEANLKAETLAVDDLVLETLGIKASGKLRGLSLLQQPKFNGEVQIANINVRDLLTRLGQKIPDTADSKSLTSAAAQITFDASPAHLTLSKLEAKLDQTTLQGNVSIRDFAKPAISFKLAADKLDADRYLPPPVTGKEKVAAPAAVAAGAATLPMETLRKLNLDGAFTLSTLKITNLQLSDIALQVRAKDGVIRTQPLSAKLYGGTYKGNLQLDARGEIPVIAMDESLSDVQIGPLTQDFLKKDLVSGTGNIQFKLTTKGITADEAKKTLTGRAAFSIANGGVKGINLLHLIKEDYAKYASKVVSDTKELDQTVFSKFAASASITNGLIDTQDLSVNSAQLNVAGKGTANLVSEQLDLRLDITPTGQLAKELGELKNIVIPVKVLGTITAPIFKTELDKALKGVAKARLDEEKAKLEADLRKKAEEEKAKLKQQFNDQKKETEEKLKEQLKDKLKGLLR